MNVCRTISLGKLHSKSIKASKTVQGLTLFTQVFSILQRAKVHSNRSYPTRTNPRPTAATKSGTILTRSLHPLCVLLYITNAALSSYIITRIMRTNPHSREANVLYARHTRVCNPLASLSYFHSQIFRRKFPASSTSTSHTVISPVNLANFGDAVCPNVDPR
jgi:hypothetical protein